MSRRKTRPRTRARTRCMSLSSTKTSTFSPFAWICPRRSTSQASFAGVVQDLGQFPPPPGPSSRYPWQDSTASAYPGAGGACSPASCPLRHLYPSTASMYCMRCRGAMGTGTCRSWRGVQVLQDVLLAAPQEVGACAPLDLLRRVPRSQRLTPACGSSRSPSGSRAVQARRSPSGTRGRQASSPPASPWPPTGNRAFSALIAMVVNAVGFLTFWASSMTTVSQSMLARENW